MMSTGSFPAYFYPPEVGDSQVGCDTPSDLPGRTASSWSIPQSMSRHRMPETESMHALALYAGSDNGSVINHSPSILQTSEQMAPASVHLHTSSGSFLASAGHATQFPHTEGATRQLHCSPSGWNSYCVGGESRNANIPDPDVAEASAARFTDQTWEDRVATPFGSAPRVHPPLLQVRSLEASESAPIQFPSLVNGARTLEPTLPQNVDDDQEVHTFLCEWTDENGTCHMEILGDRVWMSHHLSRQHNVVGHERSQRACLWQGCADTMNKGSLARHVVSRHLRAGATCGFCSKVYSRADVAQRHTKKCKVANGTLGQRNQTK